MYWILGFIALIVFLVWDENRLMKKEAERGEANPQDGDIWTHGNQWSFPPTKEKDPHELGDE